MLQAGWIKATAAMAIVFVTLIAGTSIAIALLGITVKLLALL